MNQYLVERRLCWWSRFIEVSLSILEDLTQFCGFSLPRCPHVIQTDSVMLGSELCGGHLLLGPSFDWT